MAAMALGCEWAVVGQCAAWQWMLTLFIFQLHSINSEPTHFILNIFHFYMKLETGNVQR
jgi:hypothetical protein